MDQPRVTNGATAQNLLNLLNFGGPQNTIKTTDQSESAPAPVGVVPPQNAPSNPISASDLVARFMSPTISTPKLETKEESVSATQYDTSASKSALLELLNKQANAALAQSASDREERKEVILDPEVPVQSIEESTYTQDSAGVEEQYEPPVRIFGEVASRDHTPFEPSTTLTPQPKDSKPIFTYTNPFEALHASRNEEQRTGSPAPPQNNTPDTLGLQEMVSFGSPAAISTRKKLTPKLRSQRSTSSAPRGSSPMPVQTQTEQEQGPLPELKAEESAPSPVELIQPSAAKSYNTETEQVDIPTNPQNELDNVEESLRDKQDDSAEWEDADDSPGKDGPREVPVYNFPIKAFVSITLQLGKNSDIGIREDGVMEISRLKKEFDQLDRSLAAATSKYITYAFVKNGGMRIIRQDDGSDRHVFKNSHDRIFNVAFCTTATNGVSSENQAVLGTGVSGAVYFASVSKEGNDLFEKNELDTESLVFPPFPQADENTAGGILKTRAKRSSRHPEYFAIGRGKSIQLIWPATALSPRYGISDTNHTVDVEKFYADRPLQILTGKAGKDFTFSEDDTLIVSLDKTGRLRFWDIRSLVDENNATATRVTPTIVDTPILSLSTASPAEKSWPTSVTFVDKSRPYKKGGALRYVLVGLRQNHTLQLWDIALGKAVQELNFPHENETDGICSVNYHPETGIIVVSHPTRNSIFFIHLSAPRYTLSSQLSQATYVQRIAAKDTELPKPESTACMSGIREMSFADKGQLRSVELLPVQKSAETAKDESASLFELYVVHSKGVTCLGISREDLGWNLDNKVLYPVDALEKGLVTLKELKLGSVIEEPIRSKSPPKEVQPPPKSAKKKSKKSGQPPEEVPNGIEETQQPVSSIVSVPVHTGLESAPADSVVDIAASKEQKKAKKKAEKATQIAESSTTKPDATPAEPSTKDLQAQLDTRPTSLPAEAISTSEQETYTRGLTEDWLKSELRKIENSVSTEFRKEFDSLYQNIQSDRAAQDSSSASRQEAILRLVSSSLSTNVEKSLSRILAEQMQQAVVPAVIQHISMQITESTTSTLRQTLLHELGSNLPNTLNTALQNPLVSRSIADSVYQKLSKQLEPHITDTITKCIPSAFTGFAAATAQQVSSEVEARLNAQLRQMQLDRAADNEKVERLSNALTGMIGTLQSMSDSQAAFQSQILRDRQMLYSGGGAGPATITRQVSTARGTPDPTPLTKPKPLRVRSKADIELEEITSLMNDGRYEEGSIKWLQSAQPVKLFDELFVRFTPEYLATDVSPLVAFSIAVTVANSLNTNTERRLEWISAAFDAVDLQDPEIADLSQHAPGLITSLVQKLESLYMTVAERNPSDPILRAIPILAKKGRDMKTALIARSAGPIGPSLPPLTGARF